MPTINRLLGLGLLSAAVLLLTGCQTGPQALAPGAYRLFATSTSTSATGDDSLTIKDQTVTLSTDSGTWESAIGAPAEATTLCPPAGKGAPLALDKPLTVADLHFTRPAIFGDCGQTTPVRVTVIDLDSHNNGATIVPFTRWAEFCDTTDPDC